MTSRGFEQRLAAVEAELARLKTKVESLEPSKPWWERIAGTFENDAIYAKAMKPGRKYRRSLNPSSRKRK